MKKFMALLFIFYLSSPCVIFSEGQKKAEVEVKEELQTEGELYLEGQDKLILKIRKEELKVQKKQLYNEYRELEKSFYQKFGCSLFETNKADSFDFFLTEPLWGGSLLFLSIGTFIGVSAIFSRGPFPDTDLGDIRKGIVGVGYSVGIAELVASSVLLGRYEKKMRNASMRNASLKEKREQSLKISKQYQRIQRDFAANISETKRVDYDLSKLK